MDWWRALTAGQQEAMMKRFLLHLPQPAAAAPVPATVYVTTPSDEQTRRRKMKSLKLEPFKGTSGESVEAWLASIPEAVQRQEDLGGETWSATELYSGVTEHLKGANKWLLKLTESMTPEDRNIAYLIKTMRKKYGRHEDFFQIHQRLAARVQQPGERLEDYANSLSNIGFGMQLDTVSYIGAFINGINNEQNASQLQGDRLARGPRRYREPGGEAARQPARSKEGKAAKAELANKFDWAGLGLGFGGEIDSPPTVGTKCKPVSGLVKNLKKDPFSLAALTRLVNQRHTDGSDEKPAAAGRSKTARALEVKAEAEDHLITAVHRLTTPVAAPQQDDAGNQENTWTGANGGGNRGYYQAGYGGGGRGGRGRGQGCGGRGGLENYGPPDGRSVMQRKAESTCNHCGQSGHWWKECAIRIKSKCKEQAALAAAQAAATAAVASGEVATLAQGNE
ncbi:hypothetical protein PF005_g20662 [Phytophthora fragariae]|uniref:CCHC-type domain-containing protein n=1 Tax=Phytophthora fragariae TaxID=53985 RepID=A0A6A3ZR88_9STRA|nr:hypothetical protein PF005_g20662 [Phytophthora fragariae]KAE9237166.1 hypothetical protein PF004_g8649 [Phytophthora fragariae]KAE9240878.1 hypothetical protein PF002_g9546 [Phytophthora fragariae]